MPKKNPKSEIETNAPKRSELSVQPTVDVLSDYQETFPGDSVEEHKRMESANKQLGADEVKQQYNNL
ncbi:hypothetical protein HNQ94_000752 [Salirhabdus euzebyi]|uniref:Uncharacterized protein n=1 Tax=Salirhabdus euzebyi TaxID=394506 RepID=A0A841PTJ3_9BACI|nr:hypothetical protein [Salirhabdus euzebyi]MBB6452307.1 hypothetical protein [Salirhabdus euzebyi]